MLHITSHFPCKKPIICNSLHYFKPTHPSTKSCVLLIRAQMFPAASPKPSSALETQGLKSVPFIWQWEPAKFKPILCINTSWICLCVIKLTERKWKLQGELQISSPLINQSVWKSHTVILLTEQCLCRVWDAEGRSCKDLYPLTGGFQNYLDDFIPT